MGSIIETILSRTSAPLLMAPAPSKQELTRFFSCAARAPDHAGLKPWRFIVLQDQALVRLGKAFAATEPSAHEAQRLRLEAMPARAPMIIVSVAKLDREHRKVPVWEQQVAVGIATQHIQLAAHELGYGSIWRTGALATHPNVLQHLNIAENEQIIGFLYIGTIRSEPKPKTPSSPEEFVEFHD